MFAASISTLAPRLRLKLDAPNIENIVFKMHYRLTMTFLLLCGLIVCARELLGEHIKCFSEAVNTEKFGGWINNYCFFMSTFTIKELYDENKVKTLEIPYPGIGNHVDKKSTKIYHTYYQWVPFLLFFQAICFYMPHYIWKNKEGGRIKMLVDGLRFAAISEEDDFKVKTLNIPSKKTLDKKLEIIKKDILLRLRVTRTWSQWLVTVEFLNLLNVMFQIFIVDLFLHGNFIGLGQKVMEFGDWDKAEINPLTALFPKVTKCMYHKFGSSGTLESRDVLCTMALNNVHEKIFTALWFWFLGLFIVSVLAVIWRIGSYACSRRSSKFRAMMFQRVNSFKLEPEVVARVVKDCEFEDWLFIYYLGKNMNDIAFSKLLKLIAVELEKQEMEDNIGFTKLGFEPMIRQNSIDEKKA